MADGRTNGGLLAMALRVAAIVDGLYGLAFALTPTLLARVSQDPGFPQNPGWVRWAGGVLVGIAVGAWLASRNAPRERAQVTSLAIGHVLAALSLTYSTLSGEYRGVAWFMWLPFILVGELGLAILRLSTRP